MKFSKYALLAAEYADQFYCWNSMLRDTNLNDVMCAFDSNQSPAEHVDGLALKFNMDSYADISWGNVPPGFVQSKYTVTPKGE